MTSAGSRAGSCQIAPALSKSAPARCTRASQVAAVVSTSSSQTQPGIGYDGTVPGRNVSTSRPWPSTPSGRGSQSTPRACRWSRSRWTVGVQGPAVRCTASPRRTTTLMLPPARGTSPASGPLAVVSLTGPCWLLGRTDGQKSPSPPGSVLATSDRKNVCPPPRPAGSGGGARAVAVTAAARATHRDAEDRGHRGARGCDGLVVYAAESSPPWSQPRLDERSPASQTSTDVARQRFHGSHCSSYGVQSNV